MDWSTIFGLVNGLALLAWLVLIAAPRGDIAKAFVFYGGIGLLCLAYVLLLALIVTGAVDANAGEGAGATSFTTIAGVRAIFASDGGVVTGWTHYLALDLFAGMWIARDADAKNFSRLWQVPILLLTFMAGPAGLLLWLAVREPAARRANPRSRIRPRL